MARLSRTVVASVLVAAAFAATAHADGGPSPGVVQGWEGVLAPGGDVRYVAMPAGRQTVVAAVDTNGGRVPRFRPLRGAYGVPLVAFDGTTGGLSQDGRRLVLADAPPGGGLRVVSRLVVLDTKTLRVRSRVVLRGDFAFDALSPDARTLFLVEHVSDQDFSRYRVRAYDLAAGRLLDGAVVDKSSSETTMSGYPLARATSPDGVWVYTLYRNDAGHPFIHALDTGERRAVCIDLPWHGSQDGLWNLRMALSADRTEIVLSRRSGGVFAVVDTRTFRVLSRSLGGRL